MFTEIVIASDLSPASLGALRTGLELGSRERARVTVVHVLPPWHEARHWLAPVYEDELRVQRTLVKREQEAALDRLKAQVRQALAELGASFDARATVLIGHAPDTIAQLAADERADLVVVGTQGRRESLGSVAERVVRIAGRPVLVVPA